MSMTPSNFQYFCQRLRDLSGIVIEENKLYLVESRMLPLVRAHKLDGLDALVDKLRRAESGPLAHEIVDAMTTNETSFFRDSHPFQTLRSHILPKLMEAKAKEKEITIWCGATSSGQEPYSILMTIDAHFPELLRDWNFRMIGTDISPSMLARVKDGVYSQLEVNRGLPATMLVKYFSKIGNAWQISEEFRDRLELKELNLTGEWSRLPKCDLVMMRNVLIYFDQPTKRAVMSKVRKVLSPEGYLMLGAAESALSFEENFQRERVASTTLFRAA